MPEIFSYNVTGPRKNIIDWEGCIVFVEAIILGVIIGLFRKGRIGNLGDMQFRGVWLVILAMLVQLSPIFLARTSLSSQYLLYLPFVGMSLMVVVLFFNLDKSGIGLVIPGTLMNLVAMAVNGFRMPIAFKGLKYSGLSAVIETIEDGSLINYMNMENAVGWTRYLGKFIPLPDLYPLAKVLSVGDILIMAGIVILIQGEMKKSYYMASGSMVKYSYRSKFR